ncbi:unnamed protein product [Leptidea sinapis]|uniref:Uncharacterized protein n=1 Tax=Leptidea sinapis TaxID=189913 RepID=A0A5E4QY41_9NEOP|nr:unnamed protein product [Leptidea sinapis]
MKRTSSYCLCMLMFTMLWTRGDLRVCIIFTVDMRLE